MKRPLALRMMCVGFSINLRSALGLLSVTLALSHSELPACLQPDDQLNVHALFTNPVIGLLSQLLSCGHISFELTILALISRTSILLTH